MVTTHLFIVQFSFSIFKIDNEKLFIFLNKAIKKDIKSYFHVLTIWFSQNSLNDVVEIQAVVKNIQDQITSYSEKVTA